MPLYILLPILLNLGVPGTHGRLDLGRLDLGRRLSLGDVPCNFQEQVGIEHIGYEQLGLDQLDQLFDLVQLLVSLWFGGVLVFFRSRSEQTPKN